MSAGCWTLESWSHFCAYTTVAGLLRRFALDASGFGPRLGAFLRPAVERFGREGMGPREANARLMEALEPTPCSFCRKLHPLELLDVIDGADALICASCERGLREDSEEVCTERRDALREAVDEDGSEFTPLPWELAWEPEHALVSEDRPITARVA